MEKMAVSVTRQNSEEIDKFLDGAASFADMMFGILDGSNESEENSGDLVYRDENADDQEAVEQNKIFWEAQRQLLQATLRRTTCLESRIRQATKQALSEIDQCCCRVGGCRNCLQRELSVRLQNAGFNCYICKSKWRSSPEIPSGEHTYLEVLDKSSNPIKGEVRVVMELNFRAEFEMARANDDYNTLIARLPELLVGKTERVNALIKILCAAAKKCMKEKKMHLAPWRKQKYMEAKWLGTYQRTTAAPLPVEHLEARPQKPKASMLTFDLLDRLPGLHYTPVELVW
ncbi:Basic helix-loop-helix DNA-binding superfamily protein, putative isoform 1 [Hibiscus syriacus]|uniref:Basic helix-loop-helix DNA-binding superfamily protein, putative isoform 1 n=1 Tax=Hibiscus syriacus TaxID=106335 RepID=A0A6A2ZI90_HIBSY|nr:uncharacterized protein LOC120144645 [Hibiscus syriacus]KAE8691423.1 Basic helix-loop-helix DNA-binding superfamily protein, putative isoform 1 [Hibiscus syriacus]